jgi:hypothetical protein
LWWVGEGVLSTADRRRLTKPTGAGRSGASPDRANSGASLSDFSCT